MVDSSEPATVARAVGDGSGASAVLSVTGVGKRFGGVHALDDVGLEVRPGEIHAVVGENGAGKSTLMRIVAGLEAPDEGTVEIGGEPLDASPMAARDAGVALVHQELSLVPSLSVAENICLGDLPVTGGFLRRRAMLEVGRAAVERLGMEIDVEELVDRLSLAQRQFVEIAKALRQEPRVLILDEPTATLTPAETGELIALLKRLALDGTAIVFVSHRIPEIFELCSSATVLRDGRNVTSLELAATTPEAVVQLMVGRELDLTTRRRAHATGPTLLRVTDLVAGGVHGVSIEVAAGEIVGIGGLVGAGRTEFVRAAIGLDPIIDGRSELEVEGALHPLVSYRQAIAHGVAFVPEERRTEGLALAFTVAENVALPSARDLSSHGLLRRRDIRALGVKTTERLGIRSLSPTALAGDLSGGNQQKVVLGKWLARTLRLLVLDEPTRGVDVGAKSEVHDLIRGVADGGAGVLIVSSDLPELLSITDRIVVMKDGRVTGTLRSDEASEEAVMGLAARGGS